MKKGVSIVWDDTCQKTFEDIKEYLTKNPVLESSVSEKPFLLYVRAMYHSLGALPAQKNDEGAKNLSIISVQPWLGLKVATI